MQELLITGTLHTMDPRRPRAEAALVRAGRFARVGTREDCAAEAGGDAREIALGAGCAVPGLSDAHGHLFHYGRALVDVDLAGLHSEAACVARVAERAEEAPRGQWIRGMNWDHTLWLPPRFPTHEALSFAVPDHPVVLSRVDVHALWLNARALQACGVGRDTRDPEGGRILRASDGSPSGILLDNASELIAARIPAPSAEEREALVLRAARALVRLGVTSVHDACVGPGLEAALRALAARDALPLRVSAMLDGQVTASDAQLEEQMARCAAGPEVGRLSLRSVKLFADGALGSRGAALLEPYEDEPGNMGLLITPPAILRARVERCLSRGFQPAVHAIGDRACREVLRLFAGLAPRGLAALRPRVEHLQILRAGDAALLRPAAAVASMQPVHATSDGRWAEERLGFGTERQRGAYAWRTALEHGATLAFGSDFPVDDPDPRKGLHAAVARTLPGGRRWMPEQRLSREEALAAFTSGAAFADRAEKMRGRIRQGFQADLTLFGEDVFEVPEDRLPALPVRATIVGGRIEFEADRA